MFLSRIQLKLGTVILPFHYNRLVKILLEIYQSIKNLNKAVGLDKISARLLKDAVDVITPSLTALLNLSLQTRSFPSILYGKKRRFYPCSKRAINRMLLITVRSPFCRP